MVYKETYSLREKFLRRLATFIRKEGLSTRGDKVLVAVSGGIDSAVLLRSLMALQGKLRIEIAVAHFDHKLRGRESQRDREFVKSLALELNLPFHLGIWEKSPGKGSLQVRARRARFAFLEKTMKDFGYGKLALGHNADDQAETILMALMRGYDLKGLAGIKPIFGNRIHPLLAFSRQEILAVAQAEGWQWVEDSSNLKKDYTRNRLRLEIIPQMADLFPQFRKSLLKLAKEAEDIQIGMKNLNKKLWLEGIIKENNGIIILDIEKFLPYFNMLWNFALLDMCAKLSIEKPPSYRQIRQIGKLLSAKTGATLAIADLRILKDRGNLLFTFPENTNCELEIKECPLSEITFKHDSSCEYIDADKIAGNLALRQWHPGDRFIPLGMSQEVKISDFLVNNKIALLEKDKIKILCDGVKVIWICGLRLDNRVKITPETKKILKLTYRPLGQK